MSQWEGSFVSLNSNLPSTIPTQERLTRFSELSHWTVDCSISSSMKYPCHVEIPSPKMVNNDLGIPLALYEGSQQLTLAELENTSLEERRGERGKDYDNK